MNRPTLSVPIDRRTFLVASTVGFAGLRFGPGSLLSASPITSPPRRKLAKSTILFFLCGGASHIDTWDMKPDAPIEYRGPFKPITTSTPGIQLCEHLPLLAKQAHHLAIVRTVADFGRGTGDHHAGYYYNLTGHAPDATFQQQGNDRRAQPDDWPFMGSVVGARRPLHPKLPQVITLPHKPSKLPYIRPGQFAGFLGMHHDPFYLIGDEAKPLRFSAPSLTLQAGTSPERMIARRDLLRGLNNARRQLDHDAGVNNHLRHQERAFGLLSSADAATAFDIASEPEALRRRYGETLNGTSLLMARRLVEAGVPFITVFWKEDEKIDAKCASAGGWDTHRNNFSCLQDNLLPEFDRGFSALLEDLARRGLIDETLVLVSSEMGRRPRIGDPRSGGLIGAGRDHWTACMSVLLAGGGVRGGQVYGKTDAHAEYPAEHPVGPEDITSTVYYAMGIDNLEATDLNNRPINLLADGRALTELF